MPASEADQRGDADSTKPPSVSRKSKSKRAQSPLPWFLRPNPPNTNSGFIYKGGLRSHPHGPLRVPYPLTYGSNTMELEALADYVMRSFTTTDLSALDAQGFRPKRTLDLGCGSGYWITRAAQKWRNTEFVGFDISPVQIPLDLLDEDARARISWVHGNFLSPWPFEDNSFDHVRIRAIGNCVPEPKWSFLISEMRRVLTIGGRYEWYEEDINFPRLVPETSSEDDRSYPSRSSTPDSFLSSTSSSSSTPSFKFNPGSYSKGVLQYDPRAGYDDQVIEALYYRIFQDRHINLQPTSQIPLYINTYFNGNMIAERVRLPMPPCPCLNIRTDTQSLTRTDVDTPPTQSNPKAPTYALRFQPYRDRPTEFAGRMLNIDDLKVHHKIATEYVMAAREAIWDWLVEAQNWWEIASARDPVVAEARKDLEYAFKVFHSRLEHPSDFNGHLARFDFAEDDINHAYDDPHDETNGAGTDSPSLPDSKNGNADGPAPQSPGLHPQEAPWFSVGDFDVINLFSENGHTNQRHSRASSEVPASSRSSASAAAAAASRSRTSSAPEPTRNGTIHSLMGTYDSDGSPVHPESTSPDPKSPQNFIIINSPDAEQTVPYASRILRFFSGVKGSED